MQANLANLLINFFSSNDKARNEEYEFCLEKNIENPRIGKIFIFAESEDSLPRSDIISDKLEILVINHRPTFQTLIDYANKNLVGEVCVLANSDIIFDETISSANRTNLKENFISLSRWDIKKDGSLEYYDLSHNTGAPYHNSGWSQDAWIFESPCGIKNADFFLGVIGQDSRINQLAFDAGMNVINPSQIIIAKHYHISDYRQDSISGDPSKRLLGQYLYCQGSDSFDPPDFYHGAVMHTPNPSEGRAIRIENTNKKSRATEPLIKTEPLAAEHSDGEVSVLVTGGGGLVGTGLKRYVAQMQKENPFFSPNIRFVDSSDYDLRRPEHANSMFKSFKPKMLINLAGKVGGVKANTDYIGEFFFDNMYINLNVLHFAHVYKVDKLINILSTCIYPNDVEYPIKESSLHDGPPHDSNYGYAYAKRMADIHARAYRQQYGVNYINVIPNNIFGENDNFHLSDSHVIPAIIRKVYEAKAAKKNVELWGDGSPLRQFTYSYDIAKILFFIAQNYNSREPINIGSPEERSIRDVAEIIADCLGYDGVITWRKDMPSGQARKPTDMSKLTELGWDDYTDFNQSIKNTCDWFVENYPNVRGKENV